MVWTLVIIGCLVGAFLCEDSFWQFVLALGAENMALFLLFWRIPLRLRERKVLTITGNYAGKRKREWKRDMLVATLVPAIVVIGIFVWTILISADIDRHGCVDFSILMWGGFGYGRAVIKTQ